MLTVRSKQCIFKPQGHPPFKKMVFSPIWLCTHCVAKDELGLPRAGITGPGHHRGTEPDAHACQVSTLHPLQAYLGMLDPKQLIFKCLKMVLDLRKNIYRNKNDLKTPAPLQIDLQSPFPAYLPFLPFLSLQPLTPDTVSVSPPHPVPPYCPPHTLQTHQPFWNTALIM